MNTGPLYILKRILVFLSVAAIIGFVPVGGEIEAGSSSLLICIDPGHGGKDPGAVGPTGLTEKEVNLDIALRLRDKLTGAGYRVVMTRTTDVYRSLDERAQFANSSRANIFVSVHNNAFSLPTPNGTETYYSTYSPAQSKNLATDVHNAVLSQINTTNRGVKTANFYVLKNTYMVSCLLEGVFISNPTEEAKLKDAGFRDKIATGIFNGIKKFAGSVTIAPYQARIDDMGNTPQAFYPGEVKTFNIKVTNLSTSFTWPATGTKLVNISYHLYDKYENLVKFDGRRSPLPHDVGPGETVTIPVTVSVPSTSGEYKIEYDVVHEWVTWFSDRGSETLWKDFTVVDEQSLMDLVSDLYEFILNRTYDQDEFDGYIAELRSGGLNAGSIISNFIKSEDFQNRNLTDLEYINAIYRALLGREPDISGNDYWLSQLAEGKGRVYVLSGLFRSAEFDNVTESCGIALGSLDDDIVINDHVEEQPPSDPPDEDGGGDEIGDEEQPDESALFINNIFLQLIGRECTDEEFTGIETMLADGEYYLSDIVTSLLNGEEFDLNLTDQEFINIFYRALLGREPETTGNNYWLGRLENGESWTILPAGIFSSFEFTGICINIGIDAGEFDISQINTDGSGDSGDSGGTEVPEDPDDTGGSDIVEDPLSKFIDNIYVQFTGNSCEEQVLLEWKDDLSNGDSDVSALILLLYESESYDDQISNEEFISQVYQSLLERIADQDGNNYWLSRLDDGFDRLDMIAQIIASPEFIDICLGYSIGAGSIDIPKQEPPAAVQEEITNDTSIIGQSTATEEMMIELFITHNPSQEERARRIVKYYIQYGQLFNLRADIAWAQMIHETGFLGYTGIVPPDANNFAGLGATGAKDADGNYVYNTFSTEELGVIAHLMHLAWYVYPGHLDLKDDNGDLYCSSKYDPRHFGSVHYFNGDNDLSCLNGRWAPSPTYTGKIIQFANEIYGN